MFGFVVPRDGVLACSLTVGCVLLPCVLGGCVDPAARFEDFGERLERRERRHGTASGEEVPQEGCEPVSAAMLAGSYYFAFRPKVARDTPILALLELTPRAADAEGDLEVDVQFKPLALEDGRTPLGLVSESVMNVKADGTFAIDDFEIFIAGDANPVLPGIDFRSLMDLSGALCGEGEQPLASLCGTTLGDLLDPTPVNLDGSTFGALRVEVGAELPAVAGSCAELKGDE